MVQSKHQTASGGLLSYHNASCCHLFPKHLGLTWCKRKQDSSDLATFFHCSVFQLWCSHPHCRHFWWSVCSYAVQYTDRFFMFASQLKGSDNRQVSNIHHTFDRWFTWSTSETHKNVICWSDKLNFLFKVKEKFIVISAVYKHTERDKMANLWLHSVHIAVRGLGNGRHRQTRSP